MSQNKPQIPNQDKYSAAAPAQQGHQIIQQVQLQQFSGPLPSPEVLAEYAKIYPGLEKAIVEMAQTQTSHRIELERTVVFSREKQSNRGQIFAFILAILFVVLAAFALYLGYPKIALTIVGFTITSIVSLFIAGKNSQKPPQQKKNTPA